jgi:hypothetical protein
MFLQVSFFANPEQMDRPRWFFAIPAKGLLENLAKKKPAQAG